MITQELLQDRNIYIDSEYADSLIANCTKRIYEEINKRRMRALDFDKLNERQQNHLTDAIIDLIVYQNNTGDLYGYNGVNADGTKQALIPKYIIENLRAGGLL